MRREPRHKRDGSAWDANFLRWRRYLARLRDSRRRKVKEELRERDTTEAYKDR